MSKDELIRRLKGQLIVSCQALEGEPLYQKDGHVMNLMAKAAVIAGAAAIRTNGVQDILQIKAMVNVPIIGIIKREYEGFEGFITMTMKEIDELVATKCEIIALDATDQVRGDGLSASDFIKQIKEKYPHVLLMADVSTYQEGLNAQDAGADFVGTTLSGYTSYSKQSNEPDLDLMEQLSKKLLIPVIGEGKIHYPHQAKAAFERGVHCVVVGGAITRPLEITQRFINAIKET